MLRAISARPSSRFRPSSRSAIIEAPAIGLPQPAGAADAFKEGKLNRDFIAVVRFQGPKANGMPELHKLTTVLGILQDRGQRVALVTDGRMSGASGKVPAAIHVTPEAKSMAGRSPDPRRRHHPARRHPARWKCWSMPPNLAGRAPVEADLSDNEFGMGRELFAPFRRAVGAVRSGASVFFH
jgi:phosphogluconate dehydratase